MNIAKVAAQPVMQQVNITMMKKSMDLEKSQALEMLQTMPEVPKAPQVSGGSFDKQV